MPEIVGLDSREVRQHVQTDGSGAADKVQSDTGRGHQPEENGGEVAVIIDNACVADEMSSPVGELAIGSDECCASPISSNCGAKVSGGVLFARLKHLEAREQRLGSRRGYSESSDGLAPGEESPRSRLDETFKLSLDGDGTSQTEGNSASLGGRSAVPAELALASGLHDVRSPSMPVRRKIHPVLAFNFFLEDFVSTAQSGSVMYRPISSVRKHEMMELIKRELMTREGEKDPVDAKLSADKKNPVPTVKNGHVTNESLVDLSRPPAKFRERTRSLNAPSPVQQFGPCGRIMKNSAMVMTIQDPASQRLTWYKPPLTVLVIKKVRDAAVISPFIQLVKWFINEKRMVVFVESAVMDDPLLTQNPAFGHIQEKLMTFSESKDDLTDKIDFVVCLGGDGTLLYASSLFQQSVPPIMAFHLGSLGFLTPFQFEDFEQQVTHVLEGHAALTLRSRLRCILIRKEDELNGTIPETNQLVLNEVVIDRGPSPYLSNIDLYLDGKLITSVQGDGLIVSTPTGSTAYAVAAGASMIHPSVPAVMVTPICPHSLSFRPIVVPAGVELKIAVSPESRNTAWVSFDGRKRQELKHGDSLRVNTSIYPIPSICAQDQITDWFDSLAECLHWNVRKKQKHLDELSDLSGENAK